MPIQYSKTWKLREAHHKSLSEMEELKKFQSSTFDTIARRRLVENQDTILALLQNEINCMNDSKEYQDAESDLLFAVIQVTRMVTKLRDKNSDFEQIRTLLQ